MSEIHDENREGNRDEPPKSPGQRRIERLIFGVSLAMVVGVLTALVLLDPPWRPTTYRMAPTVSSVDTAGEDGALVVRYELENQGTTSVVEVQVEVKAGNQRVEQVIAYLPNGGRQQAAAVLYGVPAGTKPEVKVIGYQRP